MDQMNTLGCEAAQCFFSVFIEMLKHHGIECDDVVYVDIYQTMIAFMRKFNNEVLGYIKTNELSSVVQNLFYEVIQDCIVQRDSKKHFNSVRMLASAQFVYFCLKMNFLYTNRKNVNIIKLYFTMALALILGDSEILSGFDQRLYVVFRNSVVLYYQEDQDVFGNNDDELLMLLTDFFCRLGIIIGDNMLLLSNAFHDPEYRADLYLRIANTYTETPKLRFHWMKKLFKLHTDNGNTAEAAACMSHMAAFVAEFLNKTGLPVQCHVEKTHKTELAFNDFIAFTPNAQDEVRNAQLVIEAFSQLADLHDVDRKRAIVGIGVMSRDRMLKFLMKAAKSLETAQLYEILNECLRVAIPLMESRNNYADLCDAHLMLAKAYAMIIATEEAAQTGGGNPVPKPKKEEEVSVAHSTRRRNSSAASPPVDKPAVIDRNALTPKDVQPRLLGTYYRVGVYGKPLGDDLNGCEWIYKMPMLTLLAQIKNRLLEQFNKVYNGGDREKPVTITILQNSGEVPKELWDKEDEIHIQLTKVEPFFTPEDLASEDRKTMAQKAFAIDEFMYETPFTTASAKERHSSSVADQWKMQTILKTEHKFPYLATRIRVKSRREIRQTPMEVAIEAMETRTERLRSAVQAKDPKLIQIILQGSCLPTVNGGPMELCRAFLQMLPVVFEDEVESSGGDVDDEDEDEDEFLDDDEEENDEEEDEKEKEGNRSRKSSQVIHGASVVVNENGSQVSLAESSSASSLATPAGAPPPVDDVCEEDRKAAALAEEMRSTPEMQQKLRENVREFVKACGMALKMNKFMTSDQDLFHKELSNGYEKLCDDLYPYVGAIPGAAGVMGSPRALQTSKPRGGIPTTPVKNDGFATPQTPFRPVVNGYLIPSVMHERRKSRRMKKSGSVSGSGTSAIGSAAGGSSAGGGNKVPKSETFSTISLTLAQKRADESVDGDPNSSSLSSVGVATPAASGRASRKGNTRLSVLSPVGTPHAASASAMPGVNSGATPLKARVPITRFSAGDSSNEDSMTSDSDDDDDDDDDDSEEESHDDKNSSPKKSDHGHSGHHHHHHHKDDK